MRDLGDARPCAARSMMLKAEADRRLAASLRYLLGVLEEQGGTAVGGGAKVDALEASLEDGARLNAAAYALHTQLRAALEAGDAAIAVEVARAFVPAQLLVGAIAVSPQGAARGDPLVQRLFDRVMIDEHISAYKCDYDARPPDPGHFLRSRDAQARVIDLIEAHDPETAREFATYVSDILIIGSDTINAGSSFRTHGLILLRELPPERAWTTYLENLVHEAAHLHLFMVWTQDSVFHSGANQLGPSPLRRGERPMSGIFHAMFVLARTIRAKRLFASIPALSAEVAGMATAYNNRQNPAPFEQKFAEAHATLADANFTPVGRALYDSCAEMVAA